jgi:hypothetical protein
MSLLFGKVTKSFPASTFCVKQDYRKAAPLAARMPNQLKILSEPDKSNPKLGYGKQRTLTSDGGPQFQMRLIRFSGRRHECCQETKSPGRGRPGL